MQTLSEENYLKLLYKLSNSGENRISTSAMAAGLSINPASVTEKLQKLADKGLINYEKSRGVKLTPSGLRVALRVIRKHRIWETFLVKQLHFGWDEVHDIAEQLEHIQSDRLIDELEKYLGYPRYDPHGDPIPDALGKIKKLKTQPLTSVQAKKKVTVLRLADTSDEFLKYLDKISLRIGDVVEIAEIEEYDGSVTILTGKRSIVMSSEAAGNLLVSR